MRRVLVAFTALLATLPAPAQEAKHLLRVRSAPGDRYAYTLRAEMTPVGVEGRLAFSMTLSERLLSAAPGQLVWSVFSSDMKMSGTGVFEDAQESLSGFGELAYRITMNERGQVRSVSAAGISVPSLGSADIVYPAQPVAIGDSWVAPIETNFGIMRIRYTLSGITEERGVPMAIITGEYLPGQPITNIRAAEFLIELATGRAIRSSGAFEMTMDGTKVRASFDLTRFRGPQR